MPAPLSAHGNNVLRFARKDLAQAVGGTIKDVIVSEGDGHSEHYVGLLVERKSGRKGGPTETVVVWFERDPEGNGPGHYGVQPLQPGE